EFLDASGFDCEKLDEFLSSKKISLVLRLHPSNCPAPELEAKILSSKYISIDKTDDIYDSLDTYDLLITDYSSIYIDFLLTEKTIINYAFDFSDDLSTSRGMYYDFNEVSLTPEISTWTDILSFIDLFYSTGELGEKYNSRRQRIRNCFWGQAPLSAS